MRWRKNLYNHSTESKKEKKPIRLSFHHPIKRISWRKINYRTLAFTLVIAIMAYFAGCGLAATMKDGTASVMEMETVIDSKEGNWGLGFGASGSKPTGNTSSEELKEYNAYFINNTEEKVVYLTFDCGYENGNTEKILDALKKHNAKATFFVVGHYLESAPDLVKRMVAEGNTVGNHTYHHPDMTTISTQEAFEEEMNTVSDLYKTITGEKISMYYRPPRGIYSTQNLQMAKDMGYTTFFWSLAYVDWNQDKQPSHEEAYSKIMGRVHPGAIILLHNTSKTNGEIIDELLTKLENEGYTFGTLDDFIVDGKEKTEETKTEKSSEKSTEKSSTQNDKKTTKCKSE